jgi:hypothetical protein
VVHASSVKESKAIELPKGEEESSSSEDNIQKYGVSNVEEIKNQKIMNVSRRALEERERRALRLAEESFSHVNQKVCFCC